MSSCGGNSYRRTTTEFDMENNPTGNIGRVNGAEMRSPFALPLPGSIAYGDLPQFPKHGLLPFRRTIRRPPS